MDIVLVRKWWDRVERGGWGGLHFQYAALCGRRAWLFGRGLRIVNEHMRQATQTHDAAYSRDASTVGLLGLAPDRILWSERIVEEHKTRRAHQDCARAQALFYAGGLVAATGQDWRARIVDLNTRKKEVLPFDETQLACLEELSDILEHTTKVPAIVPIAACKSCSYQTLCEPHKPTTLDLEV